MAEAVSTRVNGLRICSQVILFSTTCPSVWRAVSATALHLFLSEQLFDRSQSCLPRRTTRAMMSQTVRFIQKLTSTRQEILHIGI